MTDIGAAFAEAFRLIVTGDADLIEIILLSLRVSLSALFIACVIGFSLGALLAVARFPLRGALVTVLNALMGLPPVVVGLSLYLAFSNVGPLGPLRLLYTPTAMIAAQAILVTPIVAALTRQVIHDQMREYGELLRSMRASRSEVAATLVWDARLALVTVALAGFGRALSEVGAVIIVGGNIDHVTRVMTTAIALETSKGELALAMALGLILVTLSIIVNGAVTGLREGAARLAHE